LVRTWPWAFVESCDLESEDRDWIAQIWQSIISNRLGIKTAKVDFENIPAMGRVTITSPAILELQLL
jgi:hypothetical protein